MPPSSRGSAINLPWLPSALFAVKSALSAGLSWWLISVWLGPESAALAMISSVIVVQVTSWQTVRKSLERVAGVLVGVSLAILVAHYLGVTFVTVALLVLVAQVIGLFLLRRRQSLATQIPISAALTLVIGVTATDYPLLRIVGAVVGGLIGTVISLLLSPPVYIIRARFEVAALVTQVGEGLGELAEGVAGRSTHSEAIYGHMRALEHRLDAARRAYDLGAESGRMNPWAVRSRRMLVTYPNLLRSLDQVVRQMRRIAYTIGEPELKWNEMVAYSQWPHDYAEVLSSMSMVLTYVTASMRSPLAHPPDSIAAGMEHLSRRIESCQAQLGREVPPATGGSAVAEIIHGSQHAARGSVLTDLRRMLGEVREVVATTTTTAA